ncbi:Polyadenylate-binding protein 2 [Morella rubra]|uniref:Polyadenylate-binding protein 2 n=1 Tax=Morella rubra TaxID=262757 RepID=A0A6A1VJ38_9ROSI|nr:Polyadenylate-binding protein 2 [Morella rubra]
MEFPLGHHSNKPTFKVFSKVDPNYSLTIRDGHVILAPSGPSDDFQRYKDEKYSTRVKDEQGFPCFCSREQSHWSGHQALYWSHSSYNYAYELMHSNRGYFQLLYFNFILFRLQVQLLPYNADVLDESILWTEGKDLGDGFRAIRMANNIRLNVDAFRSDKKSGGVHDGATVVLWEWNKGDNQQWKIDPYSFPDHELFLNKNIEMYDEMTIVVGEDVAEDVATGGFGRSYIDIQVENNPVLKEPIEVDMESEDKSSEKETLSNSTSSKSRSHKRRDRTNYELEGVYIMIAEKMDDIAKAITKMDAFSYVDDLYDVVMKVESFDELMLTSAFDYLMANHTIARAFVKKSVSWLSEKPISFKINRKSEADSIVKSSISSKLLDFLSDYSDDVLAEYITVLVCNGKHQYQARDDLDAFLAERTADFVSWLWDLLLNHAYQSNSGIIALSYPIDAPSVTTENDKAPLSSTRNGEGINAGQESIESGDESNKKITYAHFIVEQLVNHQSKQSPNELLQPECVNNSSSHLKSSPSGVVSQSNNSGRPRISVWDRLGKPLDSITDGSKTIRVSGVALMGQDEQVINQQTRMLPVPNVEHSMTMSGDVPQLSNNDLAKGKKSEHVVGKTCEAHAVNNIRRKRHFGEINAGLGAASVPLVGEQKLGVPRKEDSQDFKKTNLTKDSKTTTPNLGSEVLDVKQRLHQIRMEISKLRSRQIKMKKEGKPNSSLNSGLSKLLVHDSESRTILVTNVHFAATEEALSLYFAKCGLVANVAILTDGVPARPKGSAYVTFASKESVDKALELSGTQFFSRTIKVLRKAESAAATSGPTQLAGVPRRTHIANLNRDVIPGRGHFSSSHLQWRRVSIPPSEPSAPANVKLTEIAASTSQQLLSTTKSVETR